DLPEAVSPGAQPCDHAHVGSGGRRPATVVAGNESPLHPPSYGARRDPRARRDLREGQLAGLGGGIVLGLGHSGARAEGQGVGGHPVQSLKSPAMSHSVPIHLRPTAPLAERVLLPGDPGRALALAQSLLLEPLMFNHHRGLWGYTGTAGPSAAIVLSELIALGVGRAIRVGSCGALAPGLALGDLVIASEAISGDGTSRALGGGELLAADPQLTRALIREAPAARAGAIVSVDLFYEARMPPGADRALAVEMEAAALFAVGGAAGVAVACLLAVSDTF